MGDGGNDTLNLGISEFLKKLEKSAKEHKGEKQPKKTSLEKLVEEIFIPVEAVDGTPVTEPKKTSDEAIIEHLQKLGPNLSYEQVMGNLHLKFPLLHTSYHLWFLIKKHYMKPQPVPVKEPEHKAKDETKEIASQLTAVVNIWWQSFYGDLQEKPVVLLEPKNGNFVATCLNKDTISDILKAYQLVPASQGNPAAEPPPPPPYSQDALENMKNEIAIIHNLVKVVVKKIEEKEPALKPSSLEPELSIIKKLTMKKTGSKIEYYRIDGNMHKYKFTKGILMHFGQSWSKDPEHKLAVWAINNPEQANSVWVKFKGQKQLVLLSEVVDSLVKAAI